MAGSFWASSMPDQLGKTSGVTSSNLPNLVGRAKSAKPASRVSNGPGDAFWFTNSSDTFSKVRQSPRYTQLALTGTGTRASLTGGGASHAQQSANTLMMRIEDELDLQGLQDLPPSISRVRIFSSALSEVSDKLPSYRGLLLAVQKEYDGLVDRLHAELNATAPTEARLATMKAASLSYVGESMAWFQIEVTDLRKRLKDYEDEIARLKGIIEQHESSSNQLEGVSETARFMAKESHNQNLDILKHMDRMEKQVELLRKQEKEAQGQMNVLQQRCKEKDGRITTVEGQLESERNRVNNMVPKEEVVDLKEEVRLLEQKLDDSDESLQAKTRDYMSIVEAYMKVSGQGVDEQGEARPLTPRPNWFHCGGLLDPDYQHTIEKAERSQEILEHMLACSRTLLSAYGIDKAAKKLEICGRHSSHPLTLPLAAAPDKIKLLNRSQDGMAGGEEDIDGVNPLEKTTKSTTSTSALSKEVVDEWIPCDIEADTPQVFKHSDKVKNLSFSRRRVSDFMDHLLQSRLKQGSDALAKPFCQFLCENVPEEVAESDSKLWAINMFAALRRYAAEPEFLAYLLLVKGTISDVIVRDNKKLCAELLNIFVGHFESSDGSHYITKQKFFYGLREVLPNKEKEMWQDLVTYFPAGGADMLVNYDWLLFDDLYVLSPIVYAFRLQHLEEGAGMIERLDKLVRGLSDGKGNTLTYGSVEEAFNGDSDFALFASQEMASSFGLNLSDVTPDSKVDTEKFLSRIKQGDLFHVLYFPALANDEADLVAQEDKS